MRHIFEEIFIKFENTYVERILITGIIDQQELAECLRLDRLKTNEIVASVNAGFIKIALTSEMYYPKITEANTLIIKVTEDAASVSIGHESGEFVIPKSEIVQRLEILAGSKEVDIDIDELTEIGYKAGLDFIYIDSYIAETHPYYLPLKTGFDLGLKQLVSDE